MIKDQNIICISSIDWDFVWQGHQEIMAAFARNGNRVLFIENTGVRVPTFKDISRLKKRFINWRRGTSGFRQELDNLFIYSPLILPFPYSRIARLVNRFLLIHSLQRWMKVVRFHNPIIWTFLPTGIALDIIANIEKKLLVYYCIADFYELVGNARKAKMAEDRLIKESDLIFAQGEALAERCRRLNDNVYIFPFGVNIETFENFKYDDAAVPSDLLYVKKPIIGYVGGVHRHIDFRLIRFIAQMHPEWSIVLIGPPQTDTSEIDNLANVSLLGKKDFSSLPNYISQFDIGIVPYGVNGYTATVFPTKLNEYHAMGKPVVSTKLPEVVKFNVENNNLVLIGETYEGFVNCIASALNNKNSGLVNNRRVSAKKNSWVVRIGEMSSLLGLAIEKKSKCPLNWQEGLLRLYRTSVKNMQRFGVVTLSVYIVVFYTPLIWLISEPLKISQTPSRADCIIVLAGGVGESGKAGQGYEERVQYAVELYNKGYADHLIFSSGYTYVFHEVLIMKALAVSLGVPEKAIILENKTIHTYDNIIAAKEILLKNNWSKVLLISSPYHMLRVALVANKEAKGLSIVYTPILQSRFYGRGIWFGWRKAWRQINVQQIKGLLHEYLAIGYYWWKGWI